MYSHQLVRSTPRSPSISPLMKVFKASASFVCFLMPILLFFHPWTMAADDAHSRRTYIVHVQPPALESAFNAESFDRAGWYDSFLAAVSSETHLVHAYTTVVSGFAARLTAAELAVMSAMDGFVRAYPDRMYQLQTTHTPDFLGLHLRQGLWNDSNLGQGVIVGLLDTGVFPDHPSFSGAGMPPPPAKWKGKCDFNASSCNNKLIGARSFLSGQGMLSASPADDEGHGTHTASTAAGAMVPGAQVLGNAKGTAVGMAPRAHVAIYKVCTVSGCAGSDILAGLDAAVSDGVDVLSLSLGDVSTPFYRDPIAIGAYGAIEKGVFVSCAAGNSGPNASTLSNEAPWLLTVAASTMDRNIRAIVRLGNGETFDGESLYQPENYTATSYPLVYAGAFGKPNTTFCANGSFDGFDVKGKIVICERGGGVARIAKGAAVLSAGGVGMILKNGAPDAYSTLADPHVLPASHISAADGEQIKSYISSTASPVAAIVFKGTLLGTSPAPAITSFSSRGPNLASPGILKPDITGPGVSVLAAWPFPVGPPGSATNDTGVTFNIISGTSMSTPHLSGIAALIKSAHPDWSPAAIKSAIMTTATVQDRDGNPISNERNRPADVFTFGSGHVDPLKAGDPGLVYDLDASDYIGYLCFLGYSSVQVEAITRKVVACELKRKTADKDLNYPSITVFLGGSTTVGRTVKNVGEAVVTYKAAVAAPKGVEVRVQPNELQFTSVGQEMKFQVEFEAAGGGGGADAAEGYLQWVSDKHVVRSPISIRFRN